MLARPIPLGRPARIVAICAVLSILVDPAQAKCFPLRLLPLAEGVSAVQGDGLAPARDNCGRSANAGVLVGADGVVLIDPGPNRAAGRALAAAVRAITRKPVRAVVFTHAHPENVLAAGAFPRATLVASAATAALMKERCPRCLRQLRAATGAEAMRGTRIALPLAIVRGDEHLALAGRRLRLFALAHAHTPGDLAVLDEASGVLFAGGLAYGGAIPETREADVAGWLAALDRLDGVAPRRVLPGAGGIDHADPLGFTRGYLVALRTRVAALMRGGDDLAAALPQADLPQYADAPGYAERHGVNVQHTWFEMEQSSFGQ